MKKSTFFLFIISVLLIKNAWSQDTIVQQAGAEGKCANLWSYHPNNNYGHTSLFHTMGWTFWGEQGIIRSLIGFDLSVIPPNAVILNARLSLYYLNTQPDPNIQPGENESYLQLITSDWDEEAVTWNNPPTTTSEDEVYLPQSTEPQQDYPDIDVTIPIRKIFNEPESYFGLMLRLKNEDPYACMLFASGDCEITELRPRLEIIYLLCDPPTADFDYQVDGNSVSFLGISPTATSWHWDFGDGDTSNVPNPLHIYNQQGFYQVCLHVENSCYFADYCEEIEICFAPPAAGFFYTTEGQTVSFTDTSDVANDFFWDFGDGYFSSNQNPVHIYDGNGTYLTCLVASNSCGSDTVCSLVDICMPPVSGFDYEVENLDVHFANSSAEADSFFWDFGDGYYSNLENPWHQYAELDDYQACLITWNECGSDTLCQMLFMYSVFVPEENAGNLLIYPNPARDQIFIKSTETGQAALSLLDLSGKEVLQQNMEVMADETITIPLDQIRPGLYVVRFKSGKNEVFDKIVVVK